MLPFGRKGSVESSLDLGHLISQLLAEGTIKASSWNGHHIGNRKGVYVVTPYGINKGKILARKHSLAMTKVRKEFFRAPWNNANRLALLATLTAHAESCKGCSSSEGDPSN